MFHGCVRSAESVFPIIWPVVMIAYLVNGANPLKYAFSPQDSCLTDLARTNRTDRLSLTQWQEKDNL